MPKGKTWTKSQERKLRKLYPKCNTVDLVKVFGRTSAAIMSRAKLLGLIKKAAGNYPWTISMERKLIRWYPDTRNEVIARRLGLKHTQVDSKGFKLGLRKTNEFRLLWARKTAFRPNHTPANKGKKMSKELYKKAKATMFKPGSRPWNTYSKNGIISIRNHANEKSYKYIRIAQGKWVLLHSLKWEKKYGKLPAGHCLWFKDGDTMNVTLSNLELITRKENYLRNSAQARLTDGYVANALAWRDPEAKERIINEHPDLIDLKRKSLLLNRAIHEQQSK